MVKKLNLIKWTNIRNYNGVLHGDIRASNFIIQENNQCIIIDFGFSQIFEQINEKEKQLLDIEMDTLKQLLNYKSN